jgi:hypothetical protein
MMRAKLNSSSLLALFLGLLFVATMPAQWRALESANDSQSTARVTRIPFELNGNHIYIRGRVNNSQPLWFVLDTGAASSVINSSRARELGLEIREGFRAQGAGGLVESGQVSGVSINLGEVSLDNLTIGTIPLKSLEDSAGRRMDVILGYELFKSFVVEIDYETHQLSLHDRKNFVYAGTGEILPLTFAENHPYVRARITVPGREPIEGEFVIDLGSNFAVTLLPSFIKKHDILKTIPKTILSRGRGVGGEIPMPTGRIDKLEMGRFALENPVTVFPPSGTFGREGKAGNIGSAVMRRFRLIFDYSRQRMILEPNKDFHDPFEFDMSGLALTTDSPAFTSMKVLRVIDASPAAEAGVKSGDEILAINNRPAAEFKIMNVRELLKQEGRSVQLRIKRNEEILSLAFKTRRLI